MKYKIGYYSMKALIILGVYSIFAVCELNFNLLEWKVYSRILLVAICLGLFVAPQKLQDVSDKD